MAKEYIVKILNWRQYQGREVKTRSSWLRFQNDFIENPNFGDFSTDERMVWIYAMCCASKLNTDVIQVPHQCSHRVLHRCTGIAESVFHRTFEKLKKIRIVEIRTTRGRHTQDTPAFTDDTLRDETRRYETRRDEDVTMNCDFDFESLYQKYPRKIGKSKGLQICEKQIRTGGDFELLSTAIDRYVDCLATQGTEEKFIKHFSSFMTSWRDWLDPEAGTSAAITKKTDYSFLEAADESA